MVLENALQSSPERLGGHFGNVFTIDTVLGYDFAAFFNFCQFLGVHGYSSSGVGYLQSPEEFIQHQIGNCWDQTELQRAWFMRHHYKFRTYLLYYYLNDDRCPSHSILAYVEDGVWYWFEPMFCGTAVEYSGVHRYASETELLDDFGRVFTLNGQKSGLLPEELHDERWSLYEYSGPEYRIPDEEFYIHCRKGRRIL